MFLFYFFSKGIVQSDPQPLTENVGSSSEQEQISYGLPVRLKIPGINVDAVIDGLRGLTLKDQDALKFFKDEALTTEGFAAKASLSRSTASSRLNKLFSMGLLEKVAEGKQILYKVKDKNI